MKISTNAKKIADRYRKRERELQRSLLRGLTKAVKRVDQEQIKNLSGAINAAPGSYSPVPNRTGNLMRGTFEQVINYGLAIAGNTARYAMAIHTGNMTTNQGMEYAVRGRPFLDDAVIQANPSSIVMGEVRKGMAV